MDGGGGEGRKQGRGRGEPGVHPTRTRTAPRPAHAQARGLRGAHTADITPIAFASASISAALARVSLRASRLAPRSFFSLQRPCRCDFEARAPRRAAPRARRRPRLFSERKWLSPTGGDRTGQTGCNAPCVLHRKGSKSKKPKTRNALYARRSRELRIRSLAQASLGRAPQRARARARGKGGTRSAPPQGSTAAPRPTRRRRFDRMVDDGAAALPRDSRRARARSDPNLEPCRQRLRDRSARPRAPCCRPCSFAFSVAQVAPLEPRAAASPSSPRARTTGRHPCAPSASRSCSR